MRPSELALVLGALECNGISTSLAEPSVKVNKRPVSPEIQEQRITAAERKRERRRQKRLRETQ